MHVSWIRWMKTHSPLNFYYYICIKLHASSLHPLPTKSFHDDVVLPCSFSWARLSHSCSVLVLWLFEAKSALMALCLSELSGTGLYGLLSDQSVLESPLRPHRDFTNTTLFWSISVGSVSLRRAPPQSADPGRHWAVGGPWGWRRDREQTSVTTLLPHCPAAR